MQYSLPQSFFIFIVPFWAGENKVNRINFARNLKNGRTNLWALMYHVVNIIRQWMAGGGFCGKD
jgi:hypothetical protein